MNLSPISVNHPTESSGRPISSKESSLVVELPKLVDISASESETMVTFVDFGAHHLVALRVSFSRCGKASARVVLFIWKTFVEIEGGEILGCEIEKRGEGMRKCEG